MLGARLSALTAVGLTVVGAAGAAAPRLLSRGYGIVPDGSSARAYVRAVAVRDIACGGALLCVLATGSRPAVRGMVLWLSLIALGDFTIVAGLRGRAAAPNLCVHASGTALLAAVYAILRAEDQHP